MSRTLRRRFSTGARIKNVYEDSMGATSEATVYTGGLTPAVLSDKCEVDGYVSVGPNRWMRCNDIMYNASMMRQ